MSGGNGIDSGADNGIGTGTGSGTGPGGAGEATRPAPAGHERVVDGRFVLEARLGGGGMGTVWRARDLVLDRAVALKEVRPPDPGLAEYDPEAARLLRARVLREARGPGPGRPPPMWSPIHHVVDGGGDTYPWLVMELVTGGSLADLLARGPMDPAAAARLGREVLAALGAAHAAGIQHRDVKPANVLLRPDGRPVLTDFGIAAIRESTVLTATGSIIGTPDYMAPERITGESGGPASDLWSLAMMLYVAVEGRHPLRRATTLATLAAVLNEPVPPPLRAGPLTAVLNAVLVKDPAARPAFGALERMLAGVAEGAGDAGAARGTATVPAGPNRGAVAPAVDGAPGAVPPAGTGESGARTAATSYPLAPPTPAPAPVPATGPGSEPVTVLGAGAPVPPRSALRIRLAVGAVLLSAAVTAAVVTDALPDWKSLERKVTGAAPDASGTPGSASRGTATGGTGTGGTGTGPGAGKSTKSGNVLTPEGIRKAVAALTAKTGSNRVFGATVYPEYAHFRVAVKGSDTRYESYSYYPDRGLETGIIRGSIIGGDRPVELSRYDWDVVPALLRTAEKDLKVKNPTTRYLIVRPPNTTFDTPAGFSVYLTNEYSETGYLFADAKGKVVSKHPPFR
ncbi:serine/threonine-protein kinase [Streptomyces tsukubensis]|uniref:serine/threonine-protein kinase n=1 Tax=Streptomyces tsukubensis TaxID=83656 RepID=UPI0023DCF416|nr:serine/threonine-protein kinase [Streptomyces tsukubensis]